MSADERYAFLEAHAESAEDVRTIERIVELRRRLMHASSKQAGGRDHDYFSNEPWRLRIFGLDLLLSPELAPSSIDTLTEIFRDRTHMRLPGFSGEDLGAEHARAPTLVDIGANEGFYSLAMQRVNPRLRIFAVEPHPEVYSLLVENCRRNEADIRTIRTALTDSTGTIELETYPHLSTMSSRRILDLEQRWMDPGRIGRIPVPATTLPQLLREQGIGHVDLLKIDVEGDEAALIEAAAGSGNAWPSVSGESEQEIPEIPEVSASPEFPASTTPTASPEFPARSCLQGVDRIVLEWHTEALKERCIYLLRSEGFALLHEEPQRFGDLYFSRL